MGQFQLRSLTKVILLLALVLVGPALGAKAQPQTPILSQEKMDEILAEVEWTITEAMQRVDLQMRRAIAQAEGDAALNMLQVAKSAVERPEEAIHPRQGGQLPVIVWCWQDNDPFNSKYSPCALPFLMGPVPPYSTPLTAARDLQSAIDQASDLAVQLLQPVPVIVLPSFLPELLRFATFGICGDDNFEAFEEQIQMKTGVVLVGVPIGGKVRVVSPGDGPTLNASTLLGGATDFNDVLDNLGKEMEEIAGQVAGQVLSSVIEVLGERLGEILEDVYDNTLGGKLEEFLAIGSNEENEVIGFMEDAFSFLDDQVQEVAGELGVAASEFPEIAQLFEEQYKDSPAFRQQLIEDARSELRKWLTGTDQVTNTTGEHILVNAVNQFQGAIDPMLQDGLDDLNDQLVRSLGASPPVPDATVSVDIQKAVSNHFLNPVGQQIEQELSGALSDLTFIPEDLRDLLSQGGADLANQILSDVLVQNVAEVYQELAQDAQSELTAVFSEIFGTANFGETQRQMMQLGENLGETLGNTLGDGLESGLSELNADENVFGQLADELNVPFDEIGEELGQLVENVGAQALASVASQVLNVGLVFGMSLEHEQGTHGPGILVDGALLVAIFNEVSGNQASGGLGEWSLPDDGASGGGVVVQGPVPSIFIFNQITGNQATQDAGGVYFNETLGSIWLFNDVSNNTAARHGGGVMFAPGAITAFLLNDVNGNRSMLGGGGYVHSGDALVHGNSFSSNKASQHGGGLWVDVETTISDNRIANNVTPGLGGGIFVNDGSRPTLRSNSIISNFAEQHGGGIAVVEAGTAPSIVAGNGIGSNFTPGFGGGVYIDGLATPSIRGNSIGGNFAELGGGGIYWSPPASGGAGPLAAGLRQQAPQRAPLVNNRFARNHTPGNGGGVALIRENVPLHGNLFIANTADGVGGGVYVTEVFIASLRNNGFSKNRSPVGGGVHFDRINEIELENNWFLGNQSQSHGGGIYAATSERVMLTADRFQANRAQLRGGGIWIRNASEIQTSDASFTGNIAGGEGGGWYSTDVDVIDVNGGVFERNVAAASGNPTTGQGRGGGLAFEETGPVSMLGAEFIGNGASGHGGGLWVARVPEVSITAANLQGNIADMTRGGGAIADPRGGGAFFEDIVLVNVLNSTIASNAADWGGGISIVRCATATVQGNQFANNRTDTDNDGFGDGGGGLAEGPDTFVVLGGNVSNGEGNTFTGNTAGTPKPAPRQANGGAFALIASSHGDVYGNVFEANACTFTGGALYVSQTAPQTRIGGFFGGGGGQGASSDDFANRGRQNCVEPGPVLDELVIPEVEIIPPIIICLEETFEVCDSSIAPIPFRFLTDIPAEPAPNAFVDVPNQPLLISAVAIPEGPIEENEASVRLRINGEAVSQSSQLIAQSVVNPLAEGLNVDVEVVGARADAEEEGPRLGLDLLSGDLFAEGTAAIAVMLENLPEGQALDSYLVEISLNDIERYTIAEVLPPESAEAFAEQIDPGTFLLQGTVIPSAPFDGMLGVIVLNVNFSAPPSLEALPAPFDLTAINLRNRDDDRIDADDLTSGDWQIVPDGSDFIPILPPPPPPECDEYTIWVGYQVLQSPMVINRQRVIPGTQGYTAQRTPLVLGQIDTAGGEICPPVEVFGHQLGSEDDRYRFEAQAGQIINATVELVDLQASQALPTVSLENADGVIERVTQTGPGDDAFRFGDLTAPRSGTYELIVSADPDAATPFAGSLIVDLTLDGEQVEKAADCALATGPSYNDLTGDLDVTLQVQWPVTEAGSPVNAYESSLPGDPSLAVPPWPFDFNWRPEIDTSFDQDLGDVPNFLEPLPQRVSGTGNQQGIVTFRGGFLGIVDAPLVTVHNNTVEGNYAEAYGGGAYITLTDQSVRIGTPEYENFWHTNQSLMGGGIAIQEATPLVHNNRIGEWGAPNVARFGGGLYLERTESPIGGPGDNQANTIEGNVVGFQIMNEVVVPELADEIDAPSEGYAAAGGGVLIREASVALSHNRIARNAVSAAMAVGESLGGFYRMGGAGLATTGDSNVRLHENTFIENQIRPLALDFSQPVALEMLGGGLLVDQSMFPARDGLYAASTEIANVTFSQNRIEYSASTLNAAVTPEIVLHMAGGAGAVRKATGVELERGRWFANRIARDDSTGNLQSPAGGFAHGGSLAVIEDGEIALSHNRILRSEVAVFDAAMAVSGGALAIHEATGVFRQGLIAHARSGGDGGALSLKDAGGSFDHVTVANARAVENGGAVLIDEYDAAGERRFTLSNSILESFGSEDSGAVHFADSSSRVGNVTPVAFHTNNVIAALGRIYSGTETDFTGQAGLINETLVFADPLGEDYAIGDNTTSATASETGGPLGYNPDGLHALPLPRILRATEDYPTIADALADARPGDTVLIRSGTHTESLVIPDGVWVRSVSGPYHTVLENPNEPDLNGGTVGLIATQVSPRTVVSGLTLARFDIGLRTDTRSGVVASNLIVQQPTPQVGVDVVDTPAFADPQGDYFVPWLAENSVRWATQGFRVGYRLGQADQQQEEFCAINVPLPSLREPPPIPWLHHNGVAETRDGIEWVWLGQDDPVLERVPIAHNDVIPNPTRAGEAYVNLPDLTGLRHNIQEDPMFVERAVMPQRGSPLSAFQRPDQRRIGALPESPPFGDYDDNLFADEWDLLFVSALNRGLVQQEDAPFWNTFDDPPYRYDLKYRFMERADFDQDGVIDLADFDWGLQVYFGAVDVRELPIWHVWVTKGGWGR
mgnify:CR=1 FL=1